MKVLNLYAGIGGNRKLWTDVEVTAVENNESIAAIYRDFFPDDKMIITDAHQYLLEHFKEFDFIWSSPPCASHSIARFRGSHRKDTKYLYPDMNLYQEILFMRHYCKNIKWIIENVTPYYKPLLDFQKRGRHLLWANFNIKKIDLKNRTFPKDNILNMQKLNEISLQKYSINKTAVLRNMVEPELGLHILECARGNYNYLKQKQVRIF